MIKWLLLFCCIIISACHTSKQHPKVYPDHDMISIEKLARDRYGDNFFIVKNATAEYSLVMSKTKEFSEIGFDINYFIFDSNSNEIIVEDFLKSGHVDWIDEDTIKAVNRKLDKSKKRIKEVYLYNVVTKKRKDL